MRSEQWKSIWISKSIDDLKNLHGIGGFDMIDASKWDDIVYKLVENLDIVGTEKILEVGCGAGGFVDSIKRRYRNVFINGFDNCERFIEIASREVEGKFHCCDALSRIWEFNNQKFDIVLSFSVFQYFNSLDDATNVLERMYKLSNSFGKIFVGDIPNEDCKIDDKKYREKKGENKHISEGIDHLYYKKSFFKSFADSKKMSISIVDHNNLIDNLFPNTKFRYSVTMEK